MQIINKYLAREVYTTMLVVLVVLLAILMSQQFVRFMQMAATGSFPGAGIEILLLLQLPILSAVLLPASLFLGILLAYGRLYADSEMIILIACGVSPSKLLKITFGFSAIMMIIVALLSLWINPIIYHYSDSILSGAVAKSITDMARPNSFVPLADGKMIFYVDSTLKDKDGQKFSQIFAAEQLDANSLVTAKSAYQKVDPKTGDLYVMLVDGYRYTGRPGRKDYEVIKYDEYAVRLPQNSVKKATGESSKTMSELWQNRHDSESCAEIHWRIALPLSALILTILSIPLSRIKPRHGRYAKLVPAILLYVTYANFLFLAKTWLKNGTLPLFLGMWWVHLLMLAIAFFLFTRQKRANT